MESLKGTGVALVTPFDHQLNVDYDALGKLLRHTAENGVDYYVALGTTGETATLTTEEKRNVLRFIRENNPYHLPVVYGLGGNNTQALIQELSDLDLSGISAILSVSPYYNKPSQEGIITHYTLLANHSPVPLILYNIPGRTGSNLTAQTTLVLADHPNIIGIKESSGNLEQMIHIASDKPDDFMLISGDDLWAMTCYGLGGDGVISVLANALPECFMAMKESVNNNDFPGGIHEIFRLRAMHELMYRESNPSGVKRLLHELGICESHVRLPLVPASEDLGRSIRKILDSIRV